MRLRRETQPQGALGGGPRGRPAGVMVPIARATTRVAPTCDPHTHTPGMNAPAPRTQPQGALVGAAPRGRPAGVMVPIARATTRVAPTCDPHTHTPGMNAPAPRNPAAGCPGRGGPSWPPCRGGADRAGNHKGCPYMRPTFMTHTHEDLDHPLQSAVTADIGSNFLLP